MKIKLDAGAYLPTRAHPTDAGLDLYSTKEKVIFPVYTTLCRGREVIEVVPNYETFDTGVHIALPHGYYGKIESKSGLNVNHSVVSCGGVIDEGYTGSIKVKIYNFGLKPYEVHVGDKIAQLIIQPYEVPDMEVVTELDETDRGNNGFGSTGR